MKFLPKMALAVALTFTALSVSAVELGISAKDAYAKTQQTKQNVLLVDVRDPVEIMFVGFTDAVDLNVPFLLVDRTEWNAERNIFPIKRNANFVAEIKAELAKRGWDENTEVITMCRSGSERGEPSAKVLREAGLVNARYVVNGFQGSSQKEGPHAGKRLKNGWQNSGLPWSSKMNADKIYRLDK
ncbi:rhodanese-like domain-containing protein [Marinospirillum insulare]|uniref:Rhodanese domain-containing protein n=1 Tax=Marinospirillum insulare TaxID=217169 RepID=A0ABQ5ZXC0_9GAMM|nr:rhodanese-like domain-containing protein [Marinospirillum insulare]GLR64624.1 hypothetical protein GCM10007878_20620 [Marinospirillum insulare]